LKQDFQFAALARVWEIDGSKARQERTVTLAKRNDPTPQMEINDKQQKALELSRAFHDIASFSFL